MELTIDNKIDNNTKIDNEVNLFIKELNKALGEKEFSTTIEKEFYNEMPLATKYKNELENIVDDCMINMSYEKEFFYFDYDEKEDLYYLDYYSDGQVERTEIPKQGIKESKLERGWFYAWYDKEQIVEANSIKEGIKSNVELELDTLEFNNRKNK